MLMRIGVLVLILLVLVSIFLEFVGLVSGTLGVFGIKVFK